jgi:hypothetical protein
LAAIGNRHLIAHQSREKKRPHQVAGRLLDRRSRRWRDGMKESISRQTQYLADPIPKDLQFWVRKVRGLVIPGTTIAKPGGQRCQRKANQAIYPGDHLP